jgi:hypothetical protein
MARGSLAEILTSAEEFVAMVTAAASLNLSGTGGESSRAEGWLLVQAEMAIVTLATARTET